MVGLQPAAASPGCQWTVDPISSHPFFGLNAGIGLVLSGSGIAGGSTDPVGCRFAGPAYPRFSERPASDGGRHDPWADRPRRPASGSAYRPGLIRYPPSLSRPGSEHPAAFDRYPLAEVPWYEVLWGPRKAGAAGRGALHSAGLSWTDRFLRSVCLVAGLEADAALDRYLRAEAPMSWMRWRRVSHRAGLVWLFPDPWTCRGRHLGWSHGRALGPAYPVVFC